MNNLYRFPFTKHPDPNKTGFYINNNNNNLRILNSDIEIKGIIRLNDNNEFEGYDGLNWIKFNALKGDKGDKGKDFNQIITFINGDNNNNNQNLGKIFNVNKINTNLSNEIHTRTLRSNKFIINNKKIDQIDFNNKDNEIIMDVKSQPYIWNFTNINISELKSSKSDKFNVYGKIEKWNVNKTVMKGQVVRLSIKDNRLGIEPLEYTDITNNDNHNILGIAIETRFSNQQCEVCVEGITTVKLTNNSGEFLLSSDSIKIGMKAIVGLDGYAFGVKTEPVMKFIGLGYFLENLENTNNNYCLVRIKN